VSQVHDPQPYPFGEQPGLRVHPAYRAMRDCPGLPRVQPPFGRWSYLATRYEDVRFVLSDPRMSRAGLIGDDEPRVHPFITERTALSALDPPEHTRLRRALMGAFTARRVAALRHRVQQIVDGTLDRIELSGPPADLVASFAAPVPAIVMAELLGVSSSERDWFMARSDVVLSADPGRTPEDVAGAYREITAFLADRLAERRRRATDDLLSALLQVREQDRLSDEEMVNLATTVLIAGHETTINQIANVMYLLLADPQKARTLRASPAMIPRAMEELLRVAPVMATGGFARVATEDIQLAGITVKAGEPVLPVYYAANHDDRMFPDPGTVDFTRKNAGAHVAFSYGPHHCPGAHLARLELRVAVTSLLLRLPLLRLSVPPEELSWRRNALTRGLHSLPVTWGPES
jgi:cytochrome P450